MKWKYTLSLALASVPLLAQAQSGGSFDLSWSTVDAGGGTSSGGQFSVTGTVGQSDAGAPLTGGHFSLTGGFWSYLTIVQVPGAPVLKIKLAGPNAVLSWPIDAVGYLLEETPALSAPVWTQTLQPVVDTAAEHTVTVPAAGQMKAFRLKLQ